MLDYKTPKDLANYLLYLDSNVTAYNSYFEWKKYVKFPKRKYDNCCVTEFCDMCIALHLEDYFGIKKSIIHDFGLNHWSVKNDCHEPNYF